MEEVCGHLEREEKNYFFCSSCDVNPVAAPNKVCTVCSTTTQDWASGSNNSLYRPSTDTKIVVIEEGEDDHVSVTDEIVAKSRISYKDNFELVALRHRELARALAAVPNMNARLLEYRTVIQAAVKSFWGADRHRPVLLMNSYSENDLMSFGLAWGAIYIGLYEKKPERVPGENKRLMFVHIKQKAAELINTLYKKQRDCIPSHDVGTAFSLSDFSTTLGRPIDLPAKAVGESTDTRPQLGTITTDTKWRRKHKKLTTTTDVARRRDAKRLLAEGLAGLTHTAAEDQLSEVAKNEAMCPDSRIMSRKMLKKMQACSPDDRCEVCVVRLRPMDKTNLGFPQANSLLLVRAYTLSLIRGHRPFVESLGAVSLESLDRHTAYYRHASRVLGLVAENRDGSTSPTRFGFDLAETTKSSAEEKALFLQQILASPTLAKVAWAFQSQIIDIDHNRLVESIMSAVSKRPGYTSVGAKTAQRRVGTLKQWHKYVRRIN